MHNKNMKVWQKRIVFILLVLIVFIILFQTLPGIVNVAEYERENIDYYASSKDNKKIISVVYDDSASMSDQGNNSWAYADYAFQIFVSLLNENDDLYVTYMSTPSQSRHIASTDVDRQESIDEVWEHFNNKTTPLTAVTTAYERLDELDQEEENADFWLVILTDGYLQGSGSTELLSSDYIEKIVSDYSKATLSNGSKLNVVYMAMGDSAAQLSDSSESDAIIKFAATNDDIVAQMNEIAGVIEDWDDNNKLGITDVHKTGFDDEIEITTDYPLKAILALNQGTPALVQSIERIDIEGSHDELLISENLSIKCPEYPGMTSDDKLIGSTAILIGQKGYIEPGTYRIKFDGNFNADNISIFYRVASEERLYIKDVENGVYMHAGESLSNLVPYEFRKENVVSGTDISFSSYIGKESKDEKHSITITDSSGYQGNYQTNYIDENTYQEGYLYVNASTQIEGLERDLNVTIPVEHMDVYTTVIKGSKQTIKRTDLVDHNLSMLLKVNHDDQTFSRSELEKMSLTVTSSQKYVDMDVQVSNDGILKVTPYFGRSEKWFSFMAGWLQSWLIEPGTYRIVLTFYDEQEKMSFVCNEAYTVEQESLPLNIWNHILPFLIIFLVWGYTRKVRFNKNMSVSMIPLTLSDNMYTGKKQNWIAWEVRPQLFGWLSIPGNLRDLIPYVSDQIQNKHLVIAPCDDELHTVRVNTKRGYRIRAVIIREDTISRHRDVQIHVDSARITAVDTTELQTNEGVAFIIEGTSTNSKMLYLINFNRRGRKNQTKNKRYG